MVKERLNSVSGTLSFRRIHLVEGKALVNLTVAKLRHIRQKQKKKFWGKGETGSLQKETEQDREIQRHTLIKKKGVRFLLINVVVQMRSRAHKEERGNEVQKLHLP